MAADNEGLKRAKSMEKNNQKSGEGYANTTISGPKSDGNPTMNGGINRPLKGMKG